jgi:hypothetical protein
VADHISDDNADDNHAPNYAHNICFRTVSYLFSALARSWQPGGQGRAAVAAAVSWWKGYRRAGGSPFIHRQ